MLTIEQLESRLTPSNNPAFVSQNGGSVSIYGVSEKPNVITADSVGNQVRVTINGNAVFFDGVTQMYLFGGSKTDYITNNTSVNSSIYGLDGNDTIQASGGNDFIVPGQGKDVVYDLLGTNFVYTNEDIAKDTVFTNFQSTAFVGPNDQLVTFFAPNRTPGAGVVSFESGVLYIAPSNNGTNVTINEVKQNIVVTYDMGDGKGVQSLSVPKAQLDYIAYFGGAGNDVYINNTNVSEAAYGSAGNDTIVSGFGKYNLLKGSGGNDTLLARGKKADMSGNGGTDIFISQAKNAVFRTDVLDLIFGAKADDLVIQS